MSDITIVILAAGKSSRFKSNISKLLYPLCGLPIIMHVFMTAKFISKNIIIVCNPDNKNELKKILPDCKFVLQKKQMGTAHALEQSKKFIKTKYFIVLSGDSPLVSKKILKALIKNFFFNKVKATVIGFKSKNPFGYGRFIIKDNQIVDIVEQAHLNKNQKKINICNSGIIICEKKIFFKYSINIKKNRLKNEKYLTDIFNIFYKNYIPVNYYECKEEDMHGVNTINDLLTVEKILQSRYIKKFIEKGVTFNNPKTCYFNYDTNIEKFVKVENNVTFRENTIIKKGSIIKSNSYLEGVIINEYCSIGPSARIRSKSIIGKNTKIGNFVEIKNSEIGSNVSISHLSYVGDAKIGNKVNVGAGTITCNYDGKKKNKTIVKDNVFIGSNSSLIAPITIEENSKIGAGSVITKNIPKKSLAIERSDLKILRNKRTK